MVFILHDYIFTLIIKLFSPHHRTSIKIPQISHNPKQIKSSPLSAAIFPPLKNSTKKYPVSLILLDILELPKYFIFFKLLFYKVYKNFIIVTYKYSILKLFRAIYLRNINSTEPHLFFIPSNIITYQCHFYYNQTNINFRYFSWIFCRFSPKKQIFFIFLSKITEYQTEHTLLQ